MAPPTRRTLGHEPALDGLRGLAVGAVLLYHLGQANRLEWLQEGTKGGFLGVSAFLTLSGFLITSLLILEYESVGHVSLGGFWGRRFRRLMPASLLTLALVALLTPLVGTERQLADLPGEIWSALAYVANWKFVISGSDYAAVFDGAPSPLKHFWSLAVEEQSYFLLPFVVAACLRLGHRKGRRLVGTAFVLIVVLSALMGLILGGGAYSNRVYMGTDTRIAELAIGALLAVAVAGRTRLGQRGRMALVVLGPIALGMIVAAWATTDLQANWLYRGGLPAHAVAVAVVILASIQPHSPLQRILAVSPLRWIGRVSYGVYLFHWPVVWWCTPSRLGVPAVVAALVQVAITFAVATVSYRFVEQPIRTGRLVVSWRRIVVPVAATLCVALAAFALPEPDRTQVVALSASKEAVIPTTTLPDSPDETLPPPPVRVMVVGDSFALSVGLGLEHYAQNTGRIGTLNTGIVGCGFGRGGMNRGIGLERDWPEECQNREPRLVDQMKVFRPDVVLLAGGMWDITDRKLDGQSRWTHVGEPDYDDYLVREMQHLIDFFTENSDATVVWATAPSYDPKYNPQTFMGKPPYPEADPERSARFNQLLAMALASRPAAHSVDLAGWMQRFPGGEFSPNLRIDGVHFTEASTDVVAQWLAPQLVDLGRS